MKTYTVYIHVHVHVSICTQYVFMYSVCVCTLYIVYTRMKVSYLQREILCWLWFMPDSNNITKLTFRLQYCTSVKMNEYGCRDAPCEKSWKQGNPLSNTIKDTSTIMRNPLSELCREGLRMIVLVSLIVLLRGFPCFHDFSHGASLHPYSFK